MGTDVRDGNGTARTINWCGCVVQDPHPAVRALGFLPEEGHGVYVARLILTLFLLIFNSAKGLNVLLMESIVGCLCYE